MFAFLSAIYGLLSALLLKTTSSPDLHSSARQRYPFVISSLLCERGDTRVQSDGRVQVHIENTAKQQQISVLAIRIYQTCIPLITVLITSVNTVTLLHN
ncbi:Hypothetical protein AKI40_2175 [Enterobacter sp. FY-07]|nr:Hypothetical protein AKI40_2175 [Enterobacter sp. FY-07]